MSMARPAKKLKEWLEEAAAAKLQESNWSPVAGSIANTSSQTFEYPGGSRVTVSGLGGVEAVPSEVTVTQAGDTGNVPGPSYSQLGMQGYAQPMANVQRKTDQEENDRIDAEIRKLQEQIKQLDQKISNLSHEQKVSEPEYTGMTYDQYFDRKKEISKKWTEKTQHLAQIMMRSNSVSERDAAYDKYYEYNDARVEELNALDAEYKRDDVSHSKKLKDHFDAYSKKFDSLRKEQNPLHAKIAELEKQRPINQQLDASQQVYPNLPFMGARVEPLAPSIIPQQDAVLSTLQYAFGLYDPNKTRKGGQTKELEKAMLNTIGNSIRRGDTSGRVDAGADYYGEVENIPAQAYLNNYGYSVDYNKGIIVDDRFNLGSRDDGKTPYTNIGGAFGDNPLGFILNPAAQFTADRLVDLGDSVSKNIMGIDPRDDARAGFPVQYVIPWSRVPANHPAWKLRKKKKEEEGKGVESTKKKVDESLSYARIVALMKDT